MYIAYTSRGPLSTQQYNLWKFFHFDKHLQPHTLTSLLVSLHIRRIELDLTALRSIINYKQNLLDSIYRVVDRINETVSFSFFLIHITKEFR